MSSQLHEAKSTSSAHHQRLQAIAMEHRYRMHEVLERAATQCRNQIVEFAVTGTDHVWQDLCKRERDDDGAGLLSGGNAI